MATLLLKKSYRHKDLKEIAFKDLWNSRGVFTTMRILGKPAKIIFFKFFFLIPYFFEDFIKFSICGFKSINFGGFPTIRIVVNTPLDPQRSLKVTSLRLLS